MYKPNFCAECGARIERVRWRVWTSRRFCDACGKRFRRARVAWRCVVCAVLLVAGFAAGRRSRHASSSPPLVIERTDARVSTTPVNLLAQTTKPTNNNTDRSATPTDSAAATDAVRYGADGTDTERPTEAGEIVSICGARTKKGTPCSRRVRGTGRCWQHRGRAAMLPPSRLVVQGQ
ncbi:MAG TPA: hypothetical protein VF666_20265 [Pyrinomonadaceae bacterium]|jgi:hypothetical protein